MKVRRYPWPNAILASFSLATLCALGLGPSFSFAQQTPPAADEEEEPAEQVEEVVVIGFRQSLNAALNAKRESEGAVDAIVAEDIADFPDLNLAESIQRVPGVSIRRDAGEGRQISVRGLGPQFTRIRINGMEALATTGVTDAGGGTNRDRGFDFNVFASELFNSITVRKTSSAEIEEGSLGATVDLKVARPFDYDGFTFVTGVQGGYNDLAEDWNPRAAALVSNTFMDGKFGALLSLAYTDRSLKDEGSSTVRWQNGGTFAPLSGDFTSGSVSSLAQLNSAFRPRIPRYDVYTHEQERLGVTGSLQFQATDQTLFTLDGLYANLDAERTEAFLEAPVFSGGGVAQVIPRAAEVDANNTIVYGLFDNVDIRTENRFDEQTTDFTQFTLTGTHAISETLRLNGMAGRAESDYDNPIQTTLLFDALDVQGYSYDFRNDSRLPSFSYGSADVTNPGTWTLTQIRLRPQSVENTFDNYELNLEWDMNEAVTLKFGGQQKEYEVTSIESRRVNPANPTGNFETNIPAGIDPTIVAPYSTLISFGDGLDVPGGTPTTFLVPDLNAAASLFNLYDPTVFPLSTTPILGNNFAVAEEDTGAFVQADFEFEAMGLPWRGNLGVRYVETTQDSTGFTFTSGSALQTTVSRTYSDTLPAVNLAVDLTDDVIVRFGASKVMTRPGLATLNPGAAVSVSGNNRTVTAGNPLLDPFRAKAYDLGVEWYFARESLVGFGLFYKDISSFVQTTRLTRPFTGNPLGLPDSVAIAACGTDPNCTPGADWQFSLPANTPGGDLKGFELSYQQPFTFLPGQFSNLGALVNYTYVESEVQYLNADGTLALQEDLTGLSKNAANLTVYWDNGTFSARISGAYRDDYLTNVPGRNGLTPVTVTGNDVEGIVSTFNLDFASSWQVTDNVQVTLEALNLTDEFEDQFIDSQADRLSYYHHTGRQYFLGARFRY